jgi:ABC-type methionine transport system permease subunit
LLALRVFELLLKLVNFSLELELLELIGHLLHTRALRSAVGGGGLATGTITLGWRRDHHTVPFIRHANTSMSN